MQISKQSFGDLGQHWTPKNIITLMVSLRHNYGSVLEPSAGSGRFMEIIPEAEGIEIDKTVIPKELISRYSIQSFFNFPISKKYDTCIGNPPYVNGKLLSEDWFCSWKPIIPKTANAYLHFIEKSIQHLNNYGELIFIVPSSVLSDTSKGSKLRKKMCLEGAFTHFIFCDKIVKWEKAAIDTVIFRWVKGEKQKQVHTNNGLMTLFEKNGFIWLIDFDLKGIIGDFFKVTVGAAPSRSAFTISNKNTEKKYIQNGSIVMIDEKDIKIWPRRRFTPNIDKIFFLGGPTRKKNIFFYGTSERHLDNVLIPKIKIDCEKAALILNDWFLKNGEKLKIIIGGRWSIGIKQFEHCPIDNELYSKLLTIIF